MNDYEFSEFLSNKLSSALGIQINELKDLEEYEILENIASQLREIKLFEKVSIGNDITMFAYLFDTYGLRIRVNRREKALEIYKDTIEEWEVLCPLSNKDKIKEILNIANKVSIELMEEDLSRINGVLIASNENGFTKILLKKPKPLDEEHSKIISIELKTETLENNGIKYSLIMKMLSSLEELDMGIIEINEYHNLRKFIVGLLELLK